MRTRVAVIILLLLMAVAAIPAANFWRHDLEKKALDDEARRGAPGKFARLSKGYVHYDLAGPRGGRTVVLVHGFSVPYYLWDRTFPALRDAGYQVLRYDLYGRGYSDRPDVRYDGETYETQLTELLDSLGISGKVDLIGSSMGGPIVAGFACHHTDRVRSLTLAGPGYSKGGKLPDKLGLPIYGEYTMATELAPALASSQTSDFIHPENFPDWVDRYRPQMEYKGFRRAILSTLRNYVVTDWSKLYDCAGEKQVPAMLIWGRQDKDAPFELSKPILASLRQAEFVPLENAGHVPFLEQPDIVNPLLIQFLSNH